MHKKHLNMFHSCDTSVYIIINLGLLFTFAGAHNDSNIHHLERFRRGSNTDIIRNCGIKAWEYKRPSIVNGYLHNVTNFPWHATIYTTSTDNNRKIYICGATIISDRLLITAASCMFDRITKKLKDPSRLFIAIGNFIEDYDYPSPVPITRASVKDIYINCQYRGLQKNDEGDIAILRIEPSLLFTSELLPICLTDYINPHNKIGEFPAFRRTGSGGFTSTLQPERVMGTSDLDCTRKPLSNTGGIGDFSNDKFCASPQMGPNGRRPAVCIGDIGSGLTLVKDGVSYLVGILNIAPGTGVARGLTVCDENEFSVYTEVDDYVSWIQGVIDRIDQEKPLKRCPIPRQIQEIWCKLLGTPTTKADCSLEGEPISCATAVMPGTQAIVSCQTFYRPEDPALRQKRVTCNSRGQWEPKPIKCIPVCGIKNMEDPTYLHRQRQYVENYPWHVTIYRSSSSTENEIICGATVITENLLLTAASCVFNEETKKPDNPKKFYIQSEEHLFYHDGSLGPVYRQLKNIYMNCDYQGLDGNYDGDIAILHIEQPIYFRTRIKPICLDTSTQSLAVDLGRIAEVTGFDEDENGVINNRMVWQNWVPVIPRDICIKKINEKNTRKLVTADKFCTGFENHSFGFHGGRGSGLAMEINHSWYIRGIQSARIEWCRSEHENRTCDGRISALFTEVSIHREWIRYIISKVEQGKAIAECSGVFRNQAGSGVTSITTSRPGCSASQFRCGIGQCIDRFSICDGSLDCADKSDETATVCGSNECLPSHFRCAYGACIDENKKCDGVRNCADGSDEGNSACAAIRTTPSPPGREAIPGRPYSTPSTQTPQSVCLLPPDIQNGYWKLHSSQCPSKNDHCEPREGMKMLPGTRLVYICNYGYQLTDVGGVYCTIGGRWSDIPQCKEIRCKILDTSSTRADCRLNGEWTSCATPVLPRTQAELSCRTSYRQEESVSQRNIVTCNSKGQWQPEPIKCIPVCGTKSPKDIKPLIVGGHLPIIADFPWHATMYETSSNSTEKRFICGATIITDNLLITAAHCVFNEGIKKPNEPNKFVIATGNYFRDYDFEYPPPIVVRKAKVRNIYMNCDYQGLDGNYDRDIAILHIEPPLNFTSYLAPICLDTNIRSLAIDLGTDGVVAGFGRTADGSYSSILQALSVPVVPKNVCIRESNEVNSRKFLTGDKFCAGYKNGSSVCDGDSGGGLAFETNNLWYIRGIVSSGLGTITTGGIRTCDNTRYAIYTEISFHISWIQDIMLKVEEGQAIPACSTQIRRRRSDFN